MTPIENEINLGAMKLQSRPESIEKIESIVNKLVRKYKLDNRIYPNLLISLTEAVSNAINHGNCRDHTKFVYINSRIEGDTLFLIVKDEGSGFDYRKVPDPTESQNIERCGGRGVFLMKELCDCIRFANKGRVVELRFKISS